MLLSLSAFSTLYFPLEVLFYIFLILIYIILGFSFKNKYSLMTFLILILFHFNFKFSLPDFFTDKFRRNQNIYLYIKQANCKNNIEIKGVIVNKFIKSDNIYLVLKSKSVNNNAQNVYGLVLLIDKLNDNLKQIEIGDNVSVCGKTFDNHRNLLSFESSSQLYLNSQNIFCSVDLTRITTLPKSFNYYQIYNFFKNKIDDLRESILSNNLKILPNKEAILLTAIVLGDVAVAIDNDLKTIFRQVGLTHILAASGFNLSIIVVSLNFVLRNFINSLLFRYVFILVIAVVYSIMAGSSPSISRALLMVAVFLWLKLYSRRPSLIAVVLLVLIVNIILNPLCIFNVGLQLSYGATIGLIHGVHINKRICKFKMNKLIKWFSENIMSIIFAQILVFPIIIYNFNQFNLLFILANLLTAPLITIITILGFLSAIVSILISIFAKLSFIKYIFCIAILIVNWLNFPFVVLLNNIAKCLNTFEFAKIHIASPDLTIVIVYYLVIVIWLFFLRFKLVNYLCLCLIICFIIAIFNEINCNNNQKIANFTNFILISSKNKVVGIDTNNSQIINDSKMIKDYSINKYLTFYNLKFSGQKTIQKTDNLIVLDLVDKIGKINVTNWQNAKYRQIVFDNNDSKIVFSKAHKFSVDNIILPNSVKIINNVEYLNLAKDKIIYQLY